MSEIKFSPFQIMHMPYRKKPCLFAFIEPNEYRHVATFRNEECAEVFARCFNEIIDKVYLKGYMRGEKNEQTKV